MHVFFITLLTALQAMPNLLCYDDLMQHLLWVLFFCPLAKSITFATSLKQFSHLGGAKTK